MQTKELLKKVRLETGMTQKEFAKYFHIPLRTYEQWERGKREMPEYTLRLLLYKIPVSYNNLTLPTNLRR